MLPRGLALVRPGSVRRELVHSRLQNRAAVTTLLGLGRTVGLLGAALCLLGIGRGLLAATAGGDPGYVVDMVAVSLGLVRAIVTTTSLVPLLVTATTMALVLLTVAGTASVSLMAAGALGTDLLVTIRAVDMGTSLICQLIAVRTRMAARMRVTAGTRVTARTRMAFLVTARTATLV